MKNEWTNGVIKECCFSIQNRLVVQFQTCCGAVTVMIKMFAILLLWIYSDLSLIKDLANLSGLRKQDLYDLDFLLNQNKTKNNNKKKKKKKKKDKTKTTTKNK